jgi:hypothetical protein
MGCPSKVERNSAPHAPQFSVSGFGRSPAGEDDREAVPTVGTFDGVFNVLILRDT